MACPIEAVLVVPESEAREGWLADDDLTSGFFFMGWHTEDDIHSFMIPAPEEAT
jgi:hypothetical protein